MNLVVNGSYLCEATYKTQLIYKEEFPPTKTIPPFKKIKNNFHKLHNLIFN
jgi:hypothetical protein